MTVAPAIAAYIGTDNQTVIAFLTAVVTFVLAVYDARYPNTLGLFGNNTVPEDEVLNLEYIAPYDMEGDDGD